jgi:NADH-ubiquinone oxidoreductase complex I, 21 kDa subunit
LPPSYHFPNSSSFPRLLSGGNPSPAFAKISGAMNRPSAVMGAIIGATAGFMLAYQNSGGRLMGFVPNDEEVRAAARQ